MRPASAAALARELPGRVRLGALERYEPWIVLAPIVVAQWVALVVFALVVRHNDWLFYQGGDQTVFYTDAWSLAHGHIPEAEIGYGWSYLLSPIAAIFGANILSALPLVVLFQTIVLLPVAIGCVYGITARIGGRLLGYFAAALWVFAPFLSIPLWEYRGLGHLPIITPAPKALAAGVGAFPGGGLPLAVVVSRYFHFDWSRMHDNYLQLREFFWSVRLLQWLPLAGFVAAGRRSW